MTICASDRDVVETRRVLTYEFADIGLRHAFELSRQILLGIGPCRLRMRKVGCPAERIYSDQVPRCDSCLVILERREQVAAKVLAWWMFQGGRDFPAPAEVAVHPVGALLDV